MLLGSAGCRKESAPSRASSLRIVVTIPPLAGIVRGVATEDVRLSTLIAPGKSEHGYELTPQNLADLASADIVVYVGLDLDPHIARFVKEHPSAQRRVVCFADAVGFTPASTEEHHDAHEEAEEHDGDGHHHGVDPHLWLDPQLVVKVLPSIATAIAEAQKAKGAGGPAAAEATMTRSRAMADRVRALDIELAKTLEPLKGQAIVTHHNAWGRFASRYGLHIAAVIREIEGQEPTPESIAKSVEAVRSQHARGIFVEPQFNPAAAEAIAKAAGVRLGVLDPLGHGDWFELMRTNTKSLVETLGSPVGN
jgi:zinc transport system substrate-binding protein